MVWYAAASNVLTVVSLILPLTAPEASTPHKAPIRVAAVPRPQLHVAPPPRLLVTPVASRPLQVRPPIRQAAAQVLPVPTQATPAAAEKFQETGDDAEAHQTGSRDIRSIARLRRAAQALQHSGRSEQAALFLEHSSSQAAEAIAERKLQIATLQREISQLEQFASQRYTLQIRCCLLEFSDEEQLANLLTLLPSERATNRGRIQQVSARQTNVVIDHTHQIIEADAIETLAELMVKAGAARVIARPTMVTQVGRPASIHSGGHFPVLVPKGNTAAVEWEWFGDKLDVVPLPVNDHRVRFQTTFQSRPRNPRQSANADGVLLAPGAAERRVRTSYELNFGQAVCCVLGRFPAEETASGEDRAEVTRVLILTPEKLQDQRASAE